MKTYNDKDKSKAVFGIYPSRLTAENGVERLKTEGFMSADISLLLPDTVGGDQLAHEKETKAPEGATAGAGAGLVLGGTFGWLVGVGTLAIPGIGPFIAAGPILALLAGAGAGAAVGGITGGLIGMGLPEYEAKRYEGALNNGGILLSVHTGNNELIKRAKRILEETGAEDISSAGEASESPRRKDTTSSTTSTHNVF